MYLSANEFRKPVDFRQMLRFLTVIAITGTDGNFRYRTAELSF